MFPLRAETFPNAAARRCFRLVVAYDGTDFFGWQVQPGLRTIQGTLADTLRQVTGETVLPQGSGRTDTGVHAEGQVVSLQLSANIPAERLRTVLNRKLPPAIRIVRAEDAPDSFHARANVVDKTYEYRLFPRRSAGGEPERVCLPPTARFAWDCRWPLHPEPMEQAARHFLGTHDFTAFKATDPDRSQRLQAMNVPENNVRTVFHSEWVQSGDLLLYRVTGSGFLHHMVRNMVGTCVAIGAGRMPAGAIPQILQSLDRRNAGETAPPQGLHLMQVVYRESPSPSPHFSTEMNQV
ncbi:MAG: tRNA pseudouridine(38-40) synthase TruA [Janthinobacterium lividum]